jgi:hypothetical protein
MASTPEFAEIKTAVLNEVLHATNAYVLLTDLAFPLLNQELLLQHYPFIVESLVTALWGQVLMTVCRLYDPKLDSRNASLSTFLRGIQANHADDSSVSSSAREWRREYEQRIPDVLDEIEERWKTLVLHRSAYLSHRDLSKRVLPEITYGFGRECFEHAQNVLGGYFTAYEDATQVFEITGLRNDPPRFLKWCRLDDYEHHFNEDMERWRKEQEGHL